MNKAAAEELWDTYLMAYSNQTSEERERLLRLSVSEDVVSTNPADESRGFEQFLAHVENFQRRLPGAFFKSNRLLFHHDQLLSEWTLFKSDGSAVTTAHTYAKLNEEGRLQQLVGFF